MSLGDLLELDTEDKILIERDLFINIKAGRLALGPDADACYQILSLFNLDGLMPYIDHFNPSRNAPYHGAFHEAVAVSLVYEAARFYGLGREDTRILLIAAAMHDFNHTAGASANDQDNIAAAIEGLQKVQTYLWTSATPILQNELEAACHLIRITEYPYTTAPITLMEKIIRDMDLMMPYLPPHQAKQLFLGLKIEMERSKGKWTFQEFAAGIKSFYEAITWCSEWAVAKAATQKWDEKLATVYNLIANHNPTHTETK